MIRLLLAVLLLLGTISGAHAEISALTHVNVVNVRDGTIQPGRTILIEGERITAILESSVPIPEDVQAIDLSGRYIMPGLIDSHVHIAMSAFGALFGSPGVPALSEHEATLSPFLAHGVTTVVILSGGPDLLDVRSAIRNHSITGPRLLLASPMIASTDPIIQPPITYLVADETEALAATELFHRQGYDAIKLREDLSPELTRSIAAEGERLGIPVVGHIPREASRLSELPLRSFGFAHLYELLRMEDYDEDNPDILADLMGQNDAWVVTTLSVHANNIEKNRDYVTTLTAPGTEYVHPQLYGFWLNSRFAPNANNETMHRQMASIHGLLPELQRHGVTLLAGSDAGNPTIAPGTSLHDEFDIMIAAGLSPLHVIQSATISPAAIWGMEAGVVETGTRADLLVLETNPLEDLHAMRNPEAVMANGQWLDRESLDILLARAAALREAETQQ